MAVAAKSLEACLIEQGAVSEAIIEKARERQRDGKRLGDVLQEMGAIDGKAWAQALASHYGLPYLEQLPDDGTAAECVGVLPINFAKRYQLLPVRKDGDSVVLAAADPSALGPIDDVRVLLHKPIKVVVAPGPVIVDAINRVYDLAAEHRLGPDGRPRRGTPRADGDRFRGDAGPARRRRRGADHQADQLAPLPGGEGPRQRHSHRAVRARPHRALPHRRYPLRHHLAAEALPAGHHLARQDHGRPEHRREAPAAGRPHPHQAGRQGRRHPRLHRAHGLRRARRHASARPLHDHPAAQRAGPDRPQARSGRHADPSVARHRPGHRPDRQRQDDDALRGAVADQHHRQEHHHHRGPDRVPAARRRPDPGEPEDRADLRRRPALDPAPGPRRHHGRRDPRRRDGQDRHPGGPHRPPRLLDPAHQRFVRRHHPPASTWASSRSWSPRR